MTDFAPRSSIRQSSFVNRRFQTISLEDALIAHTRKNAYFVYFYAVHGRTLVPRTRITISRRLLQVTRLRRAPLLERLGKLRLINVVNPAVLTRQKGLAGG